MTTQEAGAAAPLLDMRREADIVRNELARVDNKAATLLAFSLGLLTALAALAVAVPRLTPAGLVLIGITALPLVLAAALALTAVRPRIQSAKVTGFVAYARASNGTEMAAAMASTDDAAEDLHLLSRIAVAKFRIVRVAVDLMRTTLVLLAVVLPLTIGGMV